MGKDDTTLLIKEKNKICLLFMYTLTTLFSIQVLSIFEEFANLMKKEFEKSMMKELAFFCRLQIKQTNEGIFISQSKHANDILHKVGMDFVKPCRTPMSSSSRTDKDEYGASFDMMRYEGIRIVFCT